MSAADFLMVWPAMTRPLTLETKDGGTTAPIQGVLRGLRADELVGGLDQDTMLFMASKVDLEAAGFYPLAKYMRVQDGGRTYTVREVRPSYFGDAVLWVKAWCKG